MQQLDNSSVKQIIDWQNYNINNLQIRPFIVQSAFRGDNFTPCFGASSRVLFNSTNSRALRHFT